MFTFMQGKYLLTIWQLLPLHHTRPDQFLFHLHVAATLHARRCHCRHPHPLTLNREYNTMDNFCLRLP